MTNSFAKSLNDVMTMWREGKIEQGIKRTEEMQKTWPGNPHLLVLAARLIQLQDESTHTLDDAKQFLLRAIELDAHSPEAPIELGYFLDNVEDDPDAASKAFAQGMAAARQHLIEGLLGQAHVCLELDKRDEAVHALIEAMHLAETEKQPLRKRYSEKIEELLKELGQMQPA